MTPSLDENVNSNVNVKSRITPAKPGAPKLCKMSQFVGNLGTFCYNKYKVKGDNECFSINYTTIKNKLLTPSSDENVNGNWNNFFTNNTTIKKQGVDTILRWKCQRELEYNLTNNTTIKTSCWHHPQMKMSTEIGTIFFTNNKRQVFDTILRWKCQQQCECPKSHHPSKARGAKIR